MRLAPLAAALATLVALAPAAAQPGREGFRGEDRPIAREESGPSLDGDGDDWRFDPRAPRPGLDAIARRAAEPLPREDLGRPTPLFLGVRQGCNAGEVTTSPNHKGCATQPLGSTVPGGGHPLFVGLTPGLNAGMVTVSRRHLGGATMPIGTTGPGPGGRPLFAGAIPGCNAGDVSVSPRHKGCPTEPIGSLR